VACQAVRWAIHAGGNVKLKGHHATACYCDKVSIHPNECSKTSEFTAHGLCEIIEMRLQSKEVGESQTERQGRGTL
jgi:hypothetical protein